jgi:hypothetical protein
VIITFVFEKNANFFGRKLAKIAENCDHNIDPWLFSSRTQFIETDRLSAADRAVGVLGAPDIEAVGAEDVATREDDRVDENLGPML